MIWRRTAEGWIEFYRSQDDTEWAFRCKTPDRLTVEDVDVIRDHLLREVERKERKPS